MDYGDYYSVLYKELLWGSIPPFPTKHQTVICERKSACRVAGAQAGCNPGGGDQARA